MEQDFRTEVVSEVWINLLIIFEVSIVLANYFLLLTSIVNCSCGTNAGQTQFNCPTRLSLVMLDCGYQKPQDRKGFKVEAIRNERYSTRIKERERTLSFSLRKRIAQVSYRGLLIEWETTYMMTKEASIYRAISKFLNLLQLLALHFHKPSRAIIL